MSFQEMMKGSQPKSKCTEAKAKLKHHKDLKIKAEERKAKLRLDLFDSEVLRKQTKDDVAEAKELRVTIKQKLNKDRSEIKALSKGIVQMKKNINSDIKEGKASIKAIDEFLGIAEKHAVVTAKAMAKWEDDLKDTNRSINVSKTRIIRSRAKKKEVCPKPKAKKDVKAKAKTKTKAKAKKK